jgi:plastocyanin
VRSVTAIPVALAVSAIASAGLLAGSASAVGPTPPAPVATPGPTPSASSPSLRVPVVPTPATEPSAPAPAAAPAPLALALPDRARAGSPATLVVTAGTAPVTVTVRWTLVQAGHVRRVRSATGELRVTDLDPGGVLVRATVGPTSVVGGFSVAAAPATTPRVASAPPPAARTADAPRLVARAASGQAVAIRDVAFAPKRITVDVGASVTWTNNGEEPHTATAADGSFDTGTLKTGQSASHTFTKAGTFGYICTIHPFMKGTVVVRGASAPAPKSSTSGSGGGGTPTGATPPSPATRPAPAGATATPASTATPARSSLPNTGDDALARLVLGAGAVALGLGLRRAARRRA